MTERTPVKGETWRTAAGEEYAVEQVDPGAVTAVRDGQRFRIGVKWLQANARPEAS